MWILLSPAASPEQVRSALQGLELWTELSRGAAGGTVALEVLPHSRQVAIERIQAVPGVADVVDRASPHPRLDRQQGHAVRVGQLAFGGTEPPVLLAGPCSAESEEQVSASSRLVSGGESEARGCSRQERGARSGGADDAAPCPADAELVIELEDVGAMRSPSTSLRAAVGIRVLAPAGEEQSKAPVGSEDGTARRSGEISRSEDGGAERSGGDARARWRSAPQRAQAPPAGEG